MTMDGVPKTIDSVQVGRALEKLPGSQSLAGKVHARVELQGSGGRQSLTGGGNLGLRGSHGVTAVASVDGRYALLVLGGPAMLLCMARRAMERAARQARSEM